MIHRPPFLLCVPLPGGEDALLPIFERVATRFAVPLEFVTQALTTDAVEMRKRSDESFKCPSNGTEPETQYTRYATFTPRIGCHTNPLDAYVDYIAQVNPREVIPSEPEGNIRLHPTYARYVDWYKSGFTPPYPDVFEQIQDGCRKLIGGNRRRILAAQDADVPALTVWMGRWNCETSLPLKYGDLVAAAA